MDESIELFVKNTKITDKAGTYSDDGYVIDLDDDDDFGRVYSNLENLVADDKLEQLGENTLLNTHSASLTYVYNDKYRIELRGDFDGDVYKLIISEAK